MNIIKTKILLLLIIIPQSIFAAEDFKITIGSNLNAKINAVFSNTPKLLETYNKIQNVPTISNLPEYQDLLRSKELSILNHSPEMQEALKVAINEIHTLSLDTTQQIDVITAQVQKLEKELRDNNSNSSPAEIKRQIYAKEAVINELKKGMHNVSQSFSKQQELYFTNPKLANNISGFTSVQKPDTSTTDTLLNTITNLDQAIDRRVTSYATTKNSAASSGDDIKQDGFWIKGLISHARQSEYQLVPGYKLNQQGVVIGLDFIDSTIGLAYGFINDKINGNIIKERINTHVATIYGFYKFQNNILIDAQARYGRSYISKSRNNFNLSKDVSHAKTEGDLYGGKLELGYDYKTQGDVHVMPSIGIGYDELNIKKYQEKGPGLNRQVAPRRVSKTAGLFGIKFSKALELSSYLIVPDVHVKYIHTLRSNNDKTRITIVNGADLLVVPSGKLEKATYRIGGSLKISKSQPVNIEVGYDFGKSKKFHSHTGYITATLAF